MDIYSWVVFLYIGGTVLIGWFLMSEIDFGVKQEKLSVNKPHWDDNRPALMSAAQKT